MCGKLNFYQSYENIDIWFDQDTVNGKTKYTFWFQGKSYERESQDEILALARELYNQWLHAANKGKRR